MKLSTMEATQPIALCQLSEQDRRTNILLQELGRPIINLNTSSAYHAEVLIFIL